MVWKEVTVGFSIAGIVAVSIPTSFYETPFIGRALPATVATPCSKSWSPR